MNHLKIEIQNSDFSYPSTSERKEALQNYIPIEHFNFAYHHSMKYLIHKELPVEKIFKNDHLFWWNDCLINRLNKLQESYIYSMTAFNRGFDDDYENCRGSQINNHIMFDYYSEIFFYFYISSRDIIIQIISIFLELEIEVSKVKINEKFINKIKKPNIKTYLETFYEDTKEIVEIRNTFAHRFTPTMDDYRMSKGSIDNQQYYSFGKQRSFYSKEITENIVLAMKSLSLLVRSLKKEIK